VATGATAKAAVKMIKSQNPSKIVLATPVIPPDTKESFSKLVDDIVVLATPKDFRAVGQYYAKFDQTNDREVITYLRKNEKEMGIASPPPEAV
jgi:putative phosphoribosyl transferase